MLGGKSVNLGRTKGASIGSNATPGAMKKAMATASGSSPRADPVSPRSVQPSPKATIHPGSSAGLKNGSTVRLAMNGSGYLNPRNQSARLKSRTRVVDLPAQKQMNMNQRKTNRTFDSRLTSSDKSSISLINKFNR